MIIVDMLYYPTRSMPLRFEEFVVHAQVVERQFQEFSKSKTLKLKTILRRNEVVSKHLDEVGMRYSNMHNLCGNDILVNSRLQP